MNGRPKKIVVLGMMSKIPVAGVVWQTVHYLLGFERLGYETYYVEAHARTPSMFMETEQDDGSGRAAAFIAHVMKRFGLGGRWAYHALHDDARCYGMTERELKQLYRTAHLLINLHGGTEPQPEHTATGRLVYVETDPVQLQVELHDELQETIDFLEPHIAFFTFGENYGAPDCLLPVSNRFHFQPTRQPVVLHLWETNGTPPGPAFTTIASWRQRWRDVKLGGETYGWSKHEQFSRFADLPGLAGQQFELALAGCDASERRALEEKGWRIREAAALSADIDAYRNYVMTSRAEWTVAKDQNVRLRSGWFSDRSATYLAAGRPVITQDTGFGNILPVGNGVFAFTETEEILDAVVEINAHYDRHSSAAIEIAHDFFDSGRVLGDLLSRVDL